MADDEEFEPRLGRMRASGAKRSRAYLSRVLAAANLARGGSTMVGRSARGGGSGGRGAGVGRVLARRDVHAAFRQRRVVVKARIVKLAGKGVAGAVAHLRYIQRDGVTRAGTPGELYGRDETGIDGPAFIGRGSGDRHQFRFIVAAEDGAEYDDLKPLTRRLMARVEEDLGTRLDWVAVDHFNTGHPHTHIIVRGKDEHGADLVIARDYLASGLRERAAELVGLDLGPRDDREIEASRRAEIGQERLTSIDRALLRDADADHCVGVSARSPFDQAFRTGRLAALARMGLAEPLGAGRWRLDDDLANTLWHMGERGDIVRTMQRALTAARLDRPAADWAVEAPGDKGAPIVGRVIARGLADEYRDRHFMIVDGVDGRTHYIAIGSADAVEPLPPEAIVRVDRLLAEVRDVDRTVVDLAAASGGRYSVDAHLGHDPRATEAFADTHVRRLEAIRRTVGGVFRAPDGSWTIAADHLARAEAYERARLRDRPVNIETLSPLPLDRLVEADAATWLDRDAAARSPTPLRAAGFGAEVEAARVRRQRWLIEEGLAPETGGTVRYSPALLAALQRRELQRVVAALSTELDLPFTESRDGDEVAGIYRRRIDLAGGRFALIQRAHDMTLVPWRPVLDPRRGEAVIGIVRGDGISWSFGRGRQGPSIE